MRRFLCASLSGIRLMVLFLLQHFSSQVYCSSKQNPTVVLDDIDDIDNKIRTSFSKYIFPSRYSCMYYRQHHPEYSNNNIVIKTF